MSNVILVYPHTGLDLQGVSVWMPLSLLQVASTLCGDYDVVIVDQRVDDDWRGTLQDLIIADTLCVGISSMTGTQIRGGLAAARVVRENNPEVPIVWGGNHPTLVPRTTAQHPLVDIVVMGEGEVTFRQLVETLEKNNHWHGIPNICFETNGEIFSNGTGTDPKYFIDQTLVPPLPYHLVDVEQYVGGRLVFGKGVRSLPYMSSQGCPHPCTFCCQPVLSGRRWRKQPAEMVLERTMRLKEEYNLDAIEFHDEEFFVDRRRGALIAEMIAGDYQWYVQTRMDDLLALDLDALERGGLRVVQPGLETGSARILEMIQKGETIEQFRLANSKLASTSIRCTYNFMMGYPTETERDLEDTVDFALELIEANPNASVAGFYVYVPYPGSELFAQAVKDGFVPPDTLVGWSAFHRQHLNTPWVDGRTETVEMLMYSSKFIDSRRFRYAFKDNLWMTGAANLMEIMYRRRWRQHSFRKTPEIYALSWLARRQFSW